MKSQYQKQFLSEQRIQQKVLKALIQKKYEIRVNFSQSKAFKLLQNEIKNESDQKIGYQTEKNHQNDNLEMNNLLENSQFQTLSLNNRQKVSPNDDLLEIIKRQNNKLAPMGWHQQRQYSRSSQMSRTYRRRRQTSKLRDAHKTLQIDKKADQIQPRLTIQNFQRSISPFSQHQNSQPKKLVWANERIQNINRTENLRQFRNYFNKPTFQSKIFSKRSNSVLSPANMRQKLTTINEFHQKNQNKMTLQLKGQAQKLNKLPVNFLQCKKPEFSTIRKKLTSMCQVRNKFERSRVSQRLVKQIVVNEDTCRPWTSRNLQQKVEEGKQAQLLQ